MGVVLRCYGIFDDAWLYDVCNYRFRRLRLHGCRQQKQEEKRQKAEFQVIRMGKGFLIMEAEKKKLGRPFGTPFKAFNFHCDADLYEWLQKIKGDRSVTRVINDILRKEAEL